jgi:nitroreductase
VGIVGLSVGRSVVIAIALERGAGELRLADFDTLELSNLNRLPGGVHHIGLPKVTLAARAIAELDPYLQVRVFFDGLTEENEEQFFTEGGKLDLVVDECDGLDMKVRLREKARELGIPVLMQTSDRGMLDIERFDLEPRRPFFHGLAGDLRAADLAGLSNEEKVPPLLKMIGASTLSLRATASLMEVERSVRTWPQLGSAVTLGGGLAADAVRRVLLGELRKSGRFYVDLGAIVRDPPASTTGPAAVTEELVRRLVGRAILAPSGGNHQPWWWTARRNRLELRDDPARRTELADFDNLATTVALGAAAESLVLAAHAEGLEVRTEVRVEEPTLAAWFELGAEHPNEGHEHDALAEQLERRRTERRLGDRSHLPLEQWEQLQVIARSVAGVDLVLVTERPEIDALADLIGKGDRLRMLDPGLCREMFSELRWSRAEAEASGDGLEVDSLALSAIDRTGLELCRRQEALELLAQWDRGSGLARLGRNWAASASALGLLTAKPADRLGFFNAGRAMQRVWLTATQQGLATHPMTFLPYGFARVLRGAGTGFAPSTVAGLHALRPAYAQAFGLEGTEGEVLLFRVFPSKGAVPPAVRRPVDAVLHLDRA